MGRLSFVLCGIFIVALFSCSFGDETFDKLFLAGKYKEAIDYADQKIPPASRTADVWVKIAQSHEELGLVEKALASYMVSWRMNPKDYASLLGAARIYNKLNQFEEAVDMAKRALDQQFSGEASWEYARACIALKRSAEAKNALEKVIETDPSNIVANRELGIIYYDEKEYAKAVPLLEKAYTTKEDPKVACQIGKSYLQTNNYTSAIDYLKKAVEKDRSLVEANLQLARAYYKMKSYTEAATEYQRIRNSIEFEPNDYFCLANSLENIDKKAESIEGYRAAILRFGDTKTNMALYSRYKVGLADYEAKRYSSALEQFEFLAIADPGASVAKNVHFLMADCYSGLKKFPEAIRSLEKSVAQDASNIEAYARLADLYTKANMSEKAKATYEKMMSLRPDDPNVYLILGDYNSKAGNYAKSFDLYVKSNSLQESPAALEGLAVSAAKLSKWDRALDAAESAVKLDKTKIEARKVLAEALMRSQSYSEAKTHLEYLASMMPTNKTYWMQLAECYENLNQQEDLIRVDQNIIKLDKENDKSRMRYAKYLLSKGKKDDAYAYFKELAVLTPRDPSVFKNLFELAFQKDEKLNAIGYLKSYLALNPNDAEAFKKLGDLYYERKDFDGALVAYRTALKVDPAVKGFYKRYAEIVIAKGQQEEVITVLTGVIRSGEADVGTYTTLGMIYMQKKAYPKAKEMYQQALMIEPQNGDALAALGECQAKLGDISGAVITYEQAIMMNPKAVDEYKALGNLYMTQNKTKEAINAYLKYLEKMPDDQGVCITVGNYFFDVKDYKNAVKYLTAVRGDAARGVQYLTQLGNSFFYSEDYERAITIFDMLIKNPRVENLKEITLRKAQAFEKMNQTEKALLTYDDYSKLKGTRDPEVDYKRAFLREKTNPVLAKQIYLENTKLFPRDARNFLQLGLMYSKDKATYSSAVQSLEKALSLSGGAENKNLYFEIAQIYGKLGMDDKELDAYKQYIQIEPQNLDANIRIGLLLMKKGKTSEGMVYLETANTFSPDNFTVISALAGGYLKTNRTKEAIGLLKKAKQQKPDDVELRKNLLKSYLTVGDKKSAAGEVKELLNMKRDNELLMMYAQLLYDDEDYNGATNAIEDIRATEPENLEALMLLAFVDRAKKKYNEAIEVYKEIIFINANYAPALYERAETYMLQSKPQWAERFYVRALRADPKMGLAELGLAFVYKSMKNKEIYLQHLQAAKNISPNDPKILDECKKAGL